MVTIAIARPQVLLTKSNASAAAKGQGVSKYGTPKTQYKIQLVRIEEPEAGDCGAWIGAHPQLGNILAKSILEKKLLAQVNDITSRGGGGGGGGGAEHRSHKKRKTSADPDGPEESIKAEVVKGKMRADFVVGSKGNTALIEVVKQQQQQGGGESS